MTRSQLIEAPRIFTITKILTNEEVAEFVSCVELEDGCSYSKRNVHIKFMSNFSGSFCNGCGVPISNVDLRTFKSELSFFFYNNFFNLNFFLGLILHRLWQLGLDGTYFSEGVRPHLKVYYNRYGS